jgi:CHAD domain-containing protein
MKRASSWVVTEGGRTPVVRVATRTLRKRLESVWSELTAACRPRNDPERVHQLRVATRRTLAALAAFRSLLPAKRRSWFEKQLRRIRRAASNTRDLDVLTGRLRGESLVIPAGIAPSAKVARVRERLVTMLAKRREISRKPIEAVRNELVADDWPGRVERLLEGIGDAGRDETFAAYGRHRFRHLLTRFFARADRKLKDAADIHQLRIDGKKLRYAMEIFTAVFPSEERAACYEALEQLQETLGAFTDHSSAADRFGRWAREKGMGPDRRTLAALQQVEDERADKARRGFVKWWKPARRRALRQQFERTLRRKPA